MSDCLNPFMPSGILKQTCSIYTRILVRMTSGSTRHKRVKELVKQKVAKLKFVNWTSKNENIVERCESADFYCINLFVYGLHFNLA